MLQKLDTEITSKSDLGLLIEGDKVYVDFGKEYGGRIAFLKQDEATLTFIRRDKGKILEYLKDEFDLDVDELGYIVQKRFYEGEKPNVHIKGESPQFGIYNEIIGETN
ncbi:hypothetical protein KAT80_03405 [Candidatus Pacearchaeota archaeon]|nr:hypothetical protein [Candidatus Pacearchaeota archaeon]